MNNIKETMQNTTNHYYIKIISFILFAGIFAGCSNDDNKRGSGQLRFRTSQENMNDVTRSGESEVLHREQIILDNGMILDITLQEDFENTIATRTLDPLSKGEYTILGYDAITDEFIDKTEGEIDGAGVFSAKDEVEFPINRTYNFVCVANVSTLDADNKKATVVRNSALRQTISTTVTNQTLTADEDKEINFLMKHTESRMRVKLKGEGFSNVSAKIYWHSYLTPNTRKPQSHTWNFYKNDFTSIPSGTSITTAVITADEYTFNFNPDSGNDLISEYKHFLPGTDATDMVLNLSGKISDVDFNGNIMLRNLGTMERNKSYIVTAAVKINSGSGDIIYFDTVGEETILKVGKWPTDIATQDNLAYFQFGSIIGLMNMSSNAWDDNCVVYNPVDVVLTGSMEDIPRLKEADWTSYNTARDWDKYTYCVSGNNYHTVDNIKKGKGDPCKLIGLSKADIQNDLNINKVPDNGMWRMPTNQENKAYIKGGTNASGDSFENSEWLFCSTSTWNGITFDSYTFPFINATNLNYDTGTQLPACGRIGDWGGYISGLGTQGWYWSSTPAAGTKGMSIQMTKSKTTLSSDSPKNGLTIRCVLQVP